MKLRNDAKSPRTIRLSGGKKFTVMPGATMTLTAEEFEEAKGHAVILDWLKTGDLVEPGADADEDQAEPGEFPGAALAKAWGILQGEGYETAEDVAAAEVADLVEIKGIGEATAEKLIAAATEAVAAEE